MSNSHRGFDLILHLCKNIILALCLSTVALAHAQEEKPDIAVAETASIEGTEVEAVSEPSSASIETEQKPLTKEPLQALETVEITDIIREKAAAIETAEAELLKAVRAQMGAENKAASEPATTEAAPKPSVIDPVKLKEQGLKIVDTVIGWLTSPPFLSQVFAILLAWFASPIIAKRLKAVLFFLREAPKKSDKFYLIRHYVFEARALLRSALIIAILALSAVVLKASLGQDWLVKLAQGLAVVFLLYNAIKQFAPNDLFNKLGTYILIPLALLMVFGYFDDLLSFLDAMALGSGENPISALTLIKLGIFGGLFFWLGNFSNEKGQTAIRSQESLDVGIREIIAKFLQITIFGAAAVMAMSAAGIGLGGLVAIFAAMSLGIGLGLQPIAANFVSGLIILFDRSVRIGDFVVLPDGQQGHVDAINMRSTTVETADGKDIMVPNTTFTENTYENWTHKDPRQRYEVEFSVSYDTDIEKLEEILIPVFEAHPVVLSEPEKPDVELRAFGDNGIHFAVEFWCDGIDDGPNKFTSDLNFEVWRALKKHNIQMPFPQRDIHIVSDVRKTKKT